MISKARGQYPNWTRRIHSERGYDRPGGHYNNWWLDKTKKAGGVKKVKPEDIDKWLDELDDYFGW